MSENNDIEPGKVYDENGNPASVSPEELLKEGIFDSMKTWLKNPRRFIEEIFDSKTGKSEALEELKNPCTVSNKGINTRKYYSEVEVKHKGKWYKLVIPTIIASLLLGGGYYALQSFGKKGEEIKHKIGTTLGDNRGGENSSEISVSETLSENAILQKQRDDFIQNARQYIHDHPLSPKNSELEKLVRRMDKTTEPDKIKRDIEYVQQYYPQFCGDTYRLTSL